MVFFIFFTPYDYLPPFVPVVVTVVVVVWLIIIVCLSITTAQSKQIILGITNANQKLF